METKTSRHQEDVRITPGPHKVNPLYIATKSVTAFFMLVFVIGISCFGAIQDAAAGLGAVRQFFGIDFTAVGFVVFCVFALAIIGTIITIVAACIQYHFLRWELTDESLLIHSGFIFKRRFEVPFHRIQTVDYKANIVDRILGIVTLKVDTAGGARNKAMLVPSIRQAEAESIRAEIFRRKRMGATGTAAVGSASAGTASGEMAASGATATAPAAPGSPGRADDGRPSSPSTRTTEGSDVFELMDDIGEARGLFAGTYHDDASVTYEYGLTGKELLLAAISNSNLGKVLIAILGALATIAGFFGGAFDTWMMDAATEVGSAFQVAATTSVKGLVFLILSVLVIALGIMIGLAIISIIGSFLSYGGFKAKRVGDRIQVERGLLQRRSQSVPVARVQAVVIEQGLVKRLLGYMQVKLLTVHGTEANKNEADPSGAVVIHPFMRTSEVTALLTGMVPEFTGDIARLEGDFKALPPAARIRARNRRALWPAVVLAVLLLVFRLTVALGSGTAGVRLVAPVTIALLVLLVIVLVYGSITAHWWYKRAAVASLPQMIAIRRGIFGEEMTFVPKNKVQSLQIKANPFQRWRKVNSLSIDTAAGVGGTAVVQRDLSIEDGRFYLEWACSHTSAARGA